jgi:hypothetical protein
MTAALPLCAPDLLPEQTLQRDLVCRLRPVLEAQPHCQGAAVVGSLGAGGGDAVSDVDLIVYCEAGTAASVLQALSEAAADVAVVHRFAGEHDAASRFEKLILSDWSSYEIHVIEPSTRFRLQPPFVELLNRDGYLSQRIAHDKPIGRATVKPYVLGEPGLLWELFNGIKWLRRGDTALTREYLSELGLRLAEAPLKP